MKQRKKGLMISTIAVLIIAGVLLGVFFGYYPHYLLAKKPVQAVAFENDKEIRVMSFNIRCKNPSDLGKKSWFYRADLIVDCIGEQSPGIVGFQEVTKAQYEYLCDTLQGYGSVIEYRDDTKNSEACPIFYRESQYLLLEKGSFWLSETPEVMSKDWGAGYYRICSYVVLQEKSSGREFVVFNTHLDNVSDEARINGIQVVLDKIEAFGDLPAILMGDLNAKESSATYHSAMEYFSDTKYLTEQTMTSCTYQNWGQALDRGCIDYVLVSKSAFCVNFYRVITDTYDGVYSSDHFPVVVGLELQ